MFKKPAEYPEFAGLPKAEQSRVLTAATARYDKAARIRMLGVLALLVTIAIVLKLTLFQAFPRLFWLAFPAFFLVSYLYLLWEINGPLYRAVRAHLAHPE